MNEQWLQRQLSVVEELMKEGTELSRKGKANEADACFREADAILDSAEEPTDDVLLLRMTAHHELGLLASRGNSPARALVHYQNSLGFGETIRARKNRDVTMELTTTLVNLGGLLMAAKQPEKAVEASRHAIEILGSKTETTQHEKLMHVFAHYHLGAGLHQSQKPAEARTALETAAKEGTELGEQGSGEVHPMLIEIWGNLARLRFTEDDFEGAAEAGKSSSGIALKLFEAGGRREHLQQFIAAEMNMVTFNEKLQNFADAEDALFRVLDVLPDDVNVYKRGEAFYGAILALDDEALEKAGLPRAEAEESFAELKNMRAQHGL